jgi:hypothetical protein
MPASVARLTRALPRLTAAGALACLVSLSTPATATASIIGGSITSGGPGAQFIELTLPFTANPNNTVGNNTFQDNNLYGFDEDQNIVLAAPLEVDIVPLGSTTLAAGTTVASHYIFFDPVNGSIDGRVDFDSDIVAIITSTARLTASDFLANTGVTYLSPGARGLEGNDQVTISGLRQIRFDTTASTPGDYVRVLTAYSPGAVPEPATMTLLCVAMATGAVRMRSRRS